MNRQISNWSTILEIIAAGMTRNTEKVANYAELLATHLEVQADPANARIATRIRTLLSTSPKPGTLVMTPVDAESRSPFVEEETLTRTPHPTASPVGLQELDRFIRYYHYQDHLLQQGLPAPRALLLYGPPGCGKTTAARYVASELHLPLLTVRLDAVLSSYLGSTAKNLRMVFEHASRRGGILFLDEFDAIAKLRDDSNEVGEIKRVVNSLIQNLDAFPTLPIIAATNHEHLLDPAIWRRFDTVIHLPLPDHAERKQLLQHFLAPQDLPSGGLDRSPTTPETAPESPITRLEALGTQGQPMRTLRAASVEATSPASGRRASRGKGKDESAPIAKSNRGASVGAQTESTESEESSSDAVGLLDDDQVNLLAELMAGCSGADIERIVLRARQEHALAPVLGAQAQTSGALEVAPTPSAPSQRHLDEAPTIPPLVEMLTWQIWRNHCLRDNQDTAAEAERSVRDERTSVVHFIDQQATAKIPARLISILTGIPGSSIARIRQRGER